MFQKIGLCASAELTSAAHKRLESGGGEKVCGKYREQPWKQTREIGTAWAKVQTCRRYVNLASQVHILSKHQ